MHGLNDRGKRVLVRSLLRSAKADVVSSRNKDGVALEGRPSGSFGGALCGLNFLPALEVVEGVLLCWDQRGDGARGCGGGGFFTILFVSLCYG